MRVSTRDRIIQAADESFYRDGFHAVGLDRILRDAGVTKTTFYNHFESKEQLVLETLRMHDRFWRNTFIRILEEKGGTDPREQLRALVEVFRYVSELECFNGCFFINVAVQFPLPHDPAHQAAVDHKAEMDRIIRDLCLRAGADDPIALAEEITIMLEGAYVTQTIARRPETVEVFRRLLDVTIDRHCPKRTESNAPAALV